MRKSLLLLTSVCLVFSCGPRQEKDERNPETGLADLKVYEGLEVTLFASEPMFSNPTNIDIDSRGRVWVCEAFNYRNQYNPKNPTRTEGDRIMILEDTDGDGKADNSKVFYQGTDVNAALGICVLGNKVIVSCSPNVFVFTDDNGDDIPDRKEVLFQGIRGVDHDHAIHAFTFAHDGRLYFNMGNEAGVLVDAKGDTVVDINGKKVVSNGKPFRDGLVMRSDPDGSNVEVVAQNFRNNYELTVDPYGTIWQSDNDDDGNKATRINYVMEYGNYGFKDEMTGASWQARRTNLEKEIPLRHWHLNDPGVVPNLLQTGSGSPTGMTMYEGTMLPEVFRGQMIHAEPGHNVIRSYPVENDGAGYKATIVKLLEGTTDQWFRPADVTVAPDGSVFVADWYDPGVGGHAMGDPNRGRIYRIAAPGAEYIISPPELSTVEGAVAALLSPNPATRYLGWTALKNMGPQAEESLQKIWTGSNTRHAAQAFWLLTRLPGGEKYIDEAINNDDANARIMGIRGARLMKMDVLKVAGKLIRDTSPQVRREMAIALRGNNTAAAATAWASLAGQYDGNDRWYLEALGIGAEDNWDLFFTTWKKQLDATPDENVDEAAAKDIVWRSRSKAALPVLGTLIANAGDEDMMRYFRAFDFHKDPSRQVVLASLATSTTGKKQLLALKHMNTADIIMTSALKQALNKTLKEYENQLEYVELVATFGLKDKSKDLLEMCVNFPDSAKGRQAAGALINWDQHTLMTNTLHGSDKDRAVALARCIDAHMYNPKAIALMEGVIVDSTLDVELRKLAVRSFGGPWESEDYLLAMARDNKIPVDMKPAAAGMFATVWRGGIRTEATKYLPMPGNKEGKALPSIDVLSEKTGTVEKGKLVFATLCANCHMVSNAGLPAGQAGANFGPDLSEIGGKLSKEAMYKAILFPDQGISFGFEGFSFKLSDGSSAFGRIVSETSDQVDLQYMDNKQTVKKSDVVSRTKLANSLMPGDLQVNMTEEELVDLVEYLMILKKDL
jgi:putative membrane-bound dehydrogenase-like protein